MVYDLEISYIDFVKWIRRILIGYGNQNYIIGQLNNILINLQSVHYSL